MNKWKKICGALFALATLNFFIWSPSGPRAEHPSSTLSRDQVIGGLSSCQHKVFLRAGKRVKFVSVHAENPKGILVAFHGCSHTAKDFCFDHATLCPGCLGLPEEVRVVEAALRQRLSFLAVSAANTQTHCWSSKKVNGSLSNDALNVASALQLEFPQGHLPLYLFGASSGGTFAGSVGQGFLSSHVAGIVAQVSVPSWKGHIPLRYMLMGRDTQQVAFADSKMKHSASKKLSLSVLGALPLDRHFLSRRISKHPQNKGMSPLISENIVDALNRSGFLNETGHLRKDPRQSPWRPVIKRALEGHAWRDNLLPDRSAISEELNVAFARHELYSDGVEEALQFLLSW